MNFKPSLSAVLRTQSSARQRTPALHRHANVFQLLLFQIAIDPRQPVPRTFQGPSGQRQSIRGVGVACQIPLQRHSSARSDDAPTQCIRLDVATQREEVIVFCHGEALEAALVEVPSAAAVVVFVIAADVRHAYPAQPAA